MKTIRIDIYPDREAYEFIEKRLALIDGQIGEMVEGKDWTYGEDLPAVVYFTETKEAFLSEEGKKAFPDLARDLERFPAGVTDRKPPSGSYDPPLFPK